MSFEHALVTKGLMIFLAVASTVAGIFDIKHYLHLQLVPHLSKHHQYWRLLIHHLACASSSDLLLIELILYNAAVNVERGFGSVKYASFLLIALGLNTIGTMLSLLILQQIPILGPLTNHVPAGPIAIVFTILYQYFRLVPDAYKFRIFGVTLSDKTWIYATSSQLIVGQFSGTALPATIGLITGYIYRSDILQLKGWRISHGVASFFQRWIKPSLNQEGLVRRANRVFPQAPVSQSPTDRDEVVTTARRRSRNQDRARRQEEQPANDDRSPQADTRGVVRQWVSEMTQVANSSDSGDVRVPRDSEIQMLTTMFPDVGREIILGVLQRSSDTGAAVETLLSASRS